MPTLEAILEGAPWVLLLVALLGGGAVVLGRLTRRPGQHQAHRRDLPPRPDHGDVTDHLDTIRNAGEARREEIRDAADRADEPTDPLGPTPADLWDRADL